MSPHSTPTILVVDDEPAVVNALRRNLRRQLGPDAAVETCTSGEQAIERLLARRFDVIVSDLHMPGLDGFGVLAMAAEIQPDCTRLILTAAADFAAAQQAVNECGVFRYLTKPWDPAALQRQIGEALDHARKLRDQRDGALAWEASQGKASAEDLERRRLEALEPGLTRVQWADDGSVVMPPLEAA